MTEKYLFNPNNGVRMKYNEAAAATGFYKVIVPDGNGGFMEEPKAASQIGLVRKKVTKKKVAAKKAE